jgi:hypothetical protein
VDTVEEEARRRKHRRRAASVGTLGVVLAVGVATIGAASAPGFSPRPTTGCGYSIVDLEFAATPGRTQDVYRCWSKGIHRGVSARASARTIAELTKGPGLKDPWLFDDVGIGLFVDGLFILGYVAALAGWCAYGVARFRSATTRRFAEYAAWAAVLAGLCDVFENVMLWQGRPANLDALVDEVWPRLALAATIPKWVLIACVAPMAIVALCTGVVRASKQLLRRAVQASRRSAVIVGVVFTAVAAAVAVTDRVADEILFAPAAVAAVAVGAASLAFVAYVLTATRIRKLSLLVAYAAVVVFVAVVLRTDGARSWWWAAGLAVGVAVLALGVRRICVLTLTEVIPLPAQLRSVPVPPSQPAVRPERSEAALEPMPTDRSLLWDRNRAVPGVDHPSDVGICFSGGGIRSGTFCLGALQMLMKPSGDGVAPLRRATYLAAVSGGSYIAGAFQMLLHQDAQTANGPIGPPPPFAEGSPEEDHVRRHGRYLADTASQWVAGVSRVLLGIAMNLILLFLVIYVVARPIGWAEHALLFRTDVPLRGIQDGMWIAIAWPAALAVILAVAAIAWRPDIEATDKTGVGTYLWRVAGLLLLLSLLVFLFVVGLPLISLGLTRAIEAIGGVISDPQGDQTDPVSGLATVVTVVSATGVASTVVTFKSRSPERLEKKAVKTDQVAAELSKYGTFAMKYAPRLAGLALGLLVLIGVALVAIGGFHRMGPLYPSTFIWELDEIWFWLAAFGALFVLYLIVDQTSWSMHPAYKRRLGSAFAIRRVPPPATGPATGPAVEALPYCDDQPALARFAAPVPTYPKLVVCAVANVSGQQLAPPKRRAVTFTFEHDRVGGPEIGWMSADQLRIALGRRHDQHSSLMAAMAMSGAAFASAMGRENRGSINALLAIGNLRLGVWLPRPSYVAQLADPDGSHPWVRMRRLTYLVKEMFGLHAPEDRFVYVTDGGHLENLGLVELVRRRCTNIWCFDAGGDPPGFPTSLSQAIELAEEELGVKIRFAPGQLEPTCIGTVPAPEKGEDPDALRKRYAAKDVAVGTVDYGDGTKGVIIYARSVMVPDSDAFVRAHAAGAPRFPYDSTGDQFFDQDQFDGYLRLGRQVAAHAIEAAESLEQLAEATSTSSGTTGIGRAALEQYDESVRAGASAPAERAPAQEDVPTGAI